MAEVNVSSDRWLRYFAYFGVMSAIMLAQILPIHAGEIGLPGPDLLVCVTFAWVLRRPHHVPTPLIALVFLIADMVLMRPPGLYTALMVVAVELLRSREPVMRERPFSMEWILAGMAMFGVTVANVLILMIFLVDQAAFGRVLIQLFMTILTYPAIILFARYCLGVRKLNPGETDIRGRRI